MPVIATRSFEPTVEEKKERREGMDPNVHRAAHVAVCRAEVAARMTL